MDRFIWLRGSPGTRKTAISMSVASALDKERTLAASFFWDKNQEGTGLDLIDRFPSTLARQLAAFNAEYKSSLVRRLRAPSFSRIGGSAAEKVKALIINPMRELEGIIRPHVAENYREIVGTITVAHECSSVYDISQLLGIHVDEVYSTLEPINPIMNVPSDDTKVVKFYHATAKEFIAGIPNDEEADKVFISDAKRYFLGLRLLRFVNGFVERKLQSLQNEGWPHHIEYAFQYLFQHLDPSLLFSQESNELQREFERFWTHNLVSFFSAGPEADD
ncbi:uncharacterized protein EI90DRAFT_3130242 [Cantharellus anzutake]|uniref:uncharacterized protein n=1 Tax=Cantharellus anzutake TaxID=1750568 RepID=UPI001904DC93|nr:uncharacterized protein EI90DRAFT_3130242 [Cantharellus anzutake]KAF8323603.1 hypothetical protein EI90DRAFT_3130242 [Cantharellus anzutake]